MGIFSLTSKKASVTLVFLIISILVISSSAIIVYEVKKSNDVGIGTGLVLLNKIQEIEEEQEVDTFENEVVDSSNSFTIYDRDSKSSSNSKKSSKSNLNFVDSNLELLSTSEDIDFVKKDFTEISSELYSRNGTDYILRDDVEYKLASSSEISFNPSLPSTVCVGASGNEKIDIGLQGGFYPSSNSETFGYCFSMTSSKSIPATLTLKIMEADWGADDLIATKSFTVYVPCDDLYSGEGDVSFSQIFEDVDLSLQFTGIGAIEVYGLVELSSYYLRDVDYSTPNYKIRKESDCQCISGACCDLRSRPYNYKPYGNQPTDETDYYFCSGTPSAAGTSYAEKRDYYCTGSSSSYTWTDSIKNTCGTCAYCKQGYSSCFFYYQNEKCGTRDCDSLDTGCRNYHDVNKVCTGGGTCSSLSCNSYTNADKGTPCETNKECDGSGNCISASIECTLNSECGTDGWIGSTFCASNDVYQGYRSYRCYNSGTTSSYCSNTDTNDKKQECGTPGCSNGVCNSCTAHSTYSCYSGDVYWYDSCGVKEEKKTECWTSGYSGSNYCYSNDVYKDYLTRGCSGSSCTSSTSKNKQQECGAQGCLGGGCIPVGIEDQEVPDCEFGYNTGEGRCKIEVCSLGKCYYV